jgi:hypothetical protein
MWRNAEHHVIETPNSWTIHTRWWEPDEAVWRDYYKIITDTGMLCYIYYDRLRDDWYLERIFD